MPARLLSIPFVILALIFLYLTWEVDRSYSLYIIPPVVLLAIVYVLSPQINWWWYRRHPPDLEEPLRQLLLQRHHRYSRWAPARRTLFRQRMALYMLNQEFMPQAIEAVPEDVKAVIAAAAVELTLGQEDFLLEPFERVVVYPHPFPSPQYPEHFHASEIYEEDGVLLFSIDQLLRSFMEPRQFFSIALYEFAKVYRHLHPGAPWPAWPVDGWELMERISGLSPDTVAAWINLPKESLSSLGVAVAHFFVFPATFREYWPDGYAALAAVFNQDPAGEVE